MVTVGDLANIKNIGTIEFTTDQAAVQQSFLTLDNATVEALVNSSKAASAGNTETLTIRAFDNPLLAAASHSLTLDATQVTSAFLNLIVTGAGGADVIKAGSGNDILTGGAGADILTGGAGADQFRMIAPVPVGTTPGNGTDTITDFAVTGGDVVGLLQGGNGWNAAGTAPGAGTSAPLAAADYIEGTVADATALVAATTTTALSS